MICEEYVVIPTYHHHFLCWFLLPHQHGSEVHTASHWNVSRLAYQCDDQTRYGPVTYRLKVCSCMPCSFSISTRYSPSSSCFTLEKPRMILSGPAVQLLHLGSVARSLEHCGRWVRSAWDYRTSQPTLNHVTWGMGSPRMSRTKKALSPSVAETLSAGFTYFGSFPLAARGVEALSQSWDTELVIFRPRLSKQQHATHRLLLRLWIILKLKSRNTLSKSVREC